MAETTTEIPVVTGAIFVSSWGYDQTNINFYRVVKVSPSGKSVTIERLSNKIVPGPGPFTHNWVVPDTDQSTHYPTETRRLRRFSSGIPYFSRSSYEYASLWNGESESETGALYGH